MMNNAIWLLLALPQWYFLSILHPLAGGPLTIASALGAISLGFGTILGLLRREKRLLLFLVPVALSELLVAIAGLLRGQVSDPWAQSSLLAFLGVQLLGVGYLIYRLKGGRGVASVLSLFVLTYALFAAFIAAMAFSDSWV